MNDIDLFQRFLGKRVKIKFRTSGFMLVGEITEVSNDFFIFQTTTRTSMINKNEIDNVMEL